MNTRRCMVIRQLYLVTMRTAGVMGRHYAAKYASASLPLRSKEQINSRPCLKLCTLNISDCETRRPPERWPSARRSGCFQPSISWLWFTSTGVVSSYFHYYFAVRCNRVPSSQAEEFHIVSSVIALFVPFLQEMLCFLFISNSNSGRIENRKKLP